MLLRDRHAYTRFDITERVCRNAPHEPRQIQRPERLQQNSLHFTFPLPSSYQIETDVIPRHVLSSFPHCLLAALRVILESLHLRS